MSAFDPRTLPIVFVGVVDPVGAGFVTNLARPGGNTTGFIALDFGLSANWLELLKELVPRVARVAVLRDPSFAAGIGQLAAMQAVAPSLGMELTPIDETCPPGPTVHPSTHENLFVLLQGDHSIRLQQEYPLRLMQFTWCSGVRTRPASAV